MESAGDAPLAGRRLVLGVSGGIAAYKSISVARELAQLGAGVDVVLTAAAADFVQPLTFEALTGRRAYSRAWEPGDALRHIRIARDAEAVIIAPATASFIARAAAGAGDDLLAAVLLATEAPVLLCPAMNDRMFAHPQTQSNLERVREIGYGVAGPATGPLAWGEGEGEGRMIEPAAIVQHARRLLQRSAAFDGRRVVVTAGPTREALDPVRYLGNRSSGKMGYALAASAWMRGADVLLISGPVALAPPDGVEIQRVETAEQMQQAVAAALPHADVLIMAAAVADFRPRHPAEDKIKRGEGKVPKVELEAAPDVLATTLHLRRPGAVIVAFALETSNVLPNAEKKLAAKRASLLVVNDATESGAGFGVPTNRVTILAPGAAAEPLPLLPKSVVAERVLDRVEPLLRRG
jgi:phosphopantothenoylcysteine decarboxylase/phosphopantothenate--cysteine ligase